MVKDCVNSDMELYTPAICLAEVKVKYVHEKKTDIGEKRIRFIIDRSVIVGMDKEVALLGAEQKVKCKLYIVDAIIYATALLLGKDLFTSDGELKGLPGVVFLA